MFTIDTHTHIIPKHLPDFTKKFGYGNFITLDHHEAGRAWMMQGEKRFREITENCWDPLVRIEEMQQHHANMQVICTIPVLFSYWAKAHDCFEISQFLNDDIDHTPFNQFHFNTNKLNDFLTTLAMVKNIEVFYDEILDISLNEDGEIDQLICSKNNHQADFFIDCTGFNRLLMNKLGAKWQSYSKYLKMKSAIVFPIGDTEEYNLWTTAQAMDYGWMFKIPVWRRSGNGYIFDSDYITPEQAKLEVEKFIGHEIDIGKHITFDPGALDKVWIKNCCAVGLSASFVEPLEATSIGTSIQQTFLLMHRLPNYDNNTIDKYNKDVNDILINIRDFVLLHYITKKQNTIFWHDVSKLELPDTLKNSLDKWNKNLPIFDDFNDITGYRLFNSTNYLQIMAPLGLFDVEKIKEEYNMIGDYYKEKSKEFLNNIKGEEKATLKIGHKEFITKIRQKVGK